MASTIYANHDAEYRIFAAYTVDNGVTYGFTAEQMTAVADELINWTAAYTDYLDPAKRPPIVLSPIQRNADDFTLSSPTH